MRDGDACNACPQGTYSDTVDAASCTSCADGLTTVSEGTYNASDCIGKETIIL